MTAGRKMTKAAWRAITENDGSLDGCFFCAGKKTKRICRPSCTVRKSNPDNYLLFDTYEEAAAAGFLPCQRCRPEVPDFAGRKAELADKMKAFIEAHYREKYDLIRLSEELYLNESYLIRAFKETTGETPLSYHNRVRCDHAAELLKNTDRSISYIASEVGYQTPSHFARVFREYMGQTPSAYRQTANENPS